MTNKCLTLGGDHVAVYMQAGSKTRRHLVQGMADLLYRHHEGVGCQHRAAHTLSVHTAPYKANQAVMLIVLSTYPGRYVQAGMSRDSLWRCMSIFGTVPSLSHGASWRSLTRSLPGLLWTAAGF